MPTYIKVTDDITEEVMKKAERELGETPETRKRSLKEIRRLIQKEDGFLPVMEDWFLLIFLRSKKFDVQKAFRTLKNFYKFKSMYSGTLTDIRPSQIRKVLEMNAVMVSPFRNTNGEVVITMLIDNFDIDVATPNEYFAAILSMTEFLNNNPINQICGYTIIYNYKNVSFRKLMRFATPSYVSLCVKCLQDTWPGRLNSVHLIHQPSFYKIVWNLAQVWLSKKLRDRIFVHGDNLEELYSSIPREILPEKIGGYLSDKVYEEFRSNVYKKESIMDLLTKYTYNGVSYGRTSSVSDNSS